MQHACTLSFITFCDTLELEHEIIFRYDSFYAPEPQRRRGERGPFEKVVQNSSSAASEM